MKFYWFLIFVFIIVGNIHVEGQTTAFAACTSRQNCTECIKISGCAWCSQSDFHGVDKQPLSRCNTKIGHSELGRFQCQKELFNPQNEIDIIKNEEISKEKLTGSGNTIPMRPQEISLKLRKGEPATFEIEYGDPEDYPLDLYYLMDLTKTMEDDKEVLAQLGDKLALRIKDITTKFRQGFGSFVDKVAMPYVMMTPKILENPCMKVGQTCAKPYGFRNHLKISNNTEAFSKTVSESALSASVDKPEGGFDALMQSIVCAEQIGWGDQARRLVIFATDAPFHLAGDGKLGGIIHVNDGECHLNSNGEYTHSTVLDYPSIAQLNHKAIQNAVNIIFAVTSDQLEIYTQLSGRIEGAKSAELSGNSSNIVDLVEEEYRQITSKVHMSDNLPKQYVRVKYFSKCLDEKIELETDTCDELPIGSNVKFTVKLELIECPQNKEEWKQKYRIYRVGLPDGIIVHLDMFCDCPCEYPENWIKKSPKCNGVGTEKCGLCECDENHFGRLCECSATMDGGIPIDETKACKNENSTEVCSGRGECYCGQCICNKRADVKEKYSGDFCECDNFSCDRYNGELCSGHGSCDCGECICSPGWTGDACECSTQTNTCVKPGNTEICSGQGQCQCGRCVCEGKYSGAYCEKCRHESCPNRCEELIPCVQCTVHGTGAIENPSDCELNCFRRPITIVDVISYDTQSEEVFCKGEDLTDQCTFYFIYGENSDKSLYINAQRTKECPPQPPIFWIVISIISAIVFFGLCAIVIWKLYTFIQDKKEYSTFKTESKGTNFGVAENPLYQTPVGIYQNPTYGKTIQ